MKTRPLTEEQKVKMHEAVTKWNARMNIRPLTTDERAKQKQAHNALMLRYIEQFPNMHD